MAADGTKLRWGYLGVCTLRLLFLGLIYAWSVFRIPLETEFGWTASQASLVFSVSMMLFCLGGLVSGMLQKKYSVRITLMLGALCMLAGFGAASRAQGLLGICCTYSLLCGFGVGLGYNSCLSVVMTWFPDKKGLVSGIALMGFGFGGMVFGTLSAKLISSIGWRSTFMIFAVLFFGVILISAFILKTAPAEFSARMAAGKNAKATLADEAYAVVTGSEKTALNKAIEDYTTVEETAEAYKAAITALSEATTAFKAAKADYEALINAKESVKAIDFSAYPYASEAKIAAAVAALNTEATSAADAKTKAQTLFNNARKAVESNAMLEFTYGSVNHSDSIAGANADKKEGWTGNIGTNSNEGYTDGDGVTSTLYLDGGWSSSAGANIDITREVNLPAGKFILTATARGSVDLTEYTMTIAGQTVNLPHIGADVNTGVFGRGWNDAYVVFETTGEPVTLEIKAISENAYQWMSINRFRIAQFAEAGEDDPVIEAPEGKVNLIANGNLAGESVESFFSKEQGVSTDPVASTIVAMAGKNLSRGIVVKSADNPSQAWDTQFWINMSEALPTGSKLHVEFDYVANKAAKASTQAHGAPGAYVWWPKSGPCGRWTPCSSRRGGSRCTRCLSALGCYWRRELHHRVAALLY